jgi:hypothetical protein
MNLAEKKVSYFIIIDNFSIVKLLSIMRINCESFNKIIYPSDRHKSKLVRIWRTITSYNKHRFKVVKNVYLFNDSSLRVQKILNQIKRERVILIEEGVAPYLKPFVKHNIFYQLFGRLFSNYHSCLVGFSSIYHSYMVVYPELVIEELKSKNIERISKDNYIYKSNIKISNTDVLLLTSPIYNNLGTINFDTYLQYVYKLIDMLLIDNRNIFLKFHPLEKERVYQGLIHRYKGKIKVIPNVIPTNAIVFSNESKLISLSFTSALLYANNQKYIYKIPEDNFPYEIYKKLFTCCGIKIINL